MPKYRYLALAAAGVMVLAPTGAAFASSAHQATKKPVLTTGKVGGTAVRKGATLKAGLAKGKKVTFSLGSIGSASCTKSSISAKVTSNTSSSAKLSLKTQTMSKCSTTISGVTISSVKAVDLPYNVTVKPGGKVSVSETKSSEPIGLEANADLGTTALTCVFTAKSASAKMSNKGNTITVSKATLTLNKNKTPASSYSTCAEVGKTTKVSLTYGPLKDGSKKVFVS
jgi:hypothetical protein